MLEAARIARFIARRMIVLASEDIGNADPQALVVQSPRPRRSTRRDARSCAQPRQAAATSRWSESTPAPPRFPARAATCSARAPPIRLPTAGSHFPGPSSWAVALDMSIRTVSRGVSIRADAQGLEDRRYYEPRTGASRPSSGSDLSTCCGNSAKSAISHYAG